MHVSRLLTKSAIAAVAAGTFAAASVAIAAAQQGSAVGPGDQTFVNQAIRSGDQEIAQAQAELKGTTDPSVREFAQRIITDHTSANQQIGAMAKYLGLSTPPLVPAAPADADMPAAAYMQQEVKDHDQAIALFKGEMANGGSSELRTAASTIVPVLETHLEMAQQYVATGRVTPLPSPAP